MNRKLGTLLLTMALISVGLPLAASTAQEEVLVIRGGQVDTLGPAGVIDGGVVVIRDGHIAAVGGPDTMTPDGATSIDATGSIVFPGFFDAVTRIGLTEIGAVAVTSDFRELGSNNAQLQGATAVHPASEIIPVTRANGITHVVAAPDGQGIAGQGSLILMDGWTVEEMVLDAGIYMVVDWPSLGGRGRFGGFRRGGFGRPFSELKAAYDEQITTLDELLGNARDYVAATASGRPEHRDLKLEALGRVTSGSMPMLINVNSPRGIRDAIDFSERNNVRIILGGASEAWKVADLIAEKGVSVILGPTQSLPRTEDDPYDAPYAQPGKLYAAGVTFAISTFNASSARTLPYEAGQAVAFGLPHDAGLAAITLNPARILGVDDELGSIEVGKIANIVVSSGDPLEIDTQIEHLIIAGHVTSTDNKQRQLYEKYRARPRRGSQ